MEFLFIRVAWIWSTAYYRNAQQIHSGRAQKGKHLLKFWKSKENRCETAPFSLTLRPCSAEFLTSAIQTPKKKIFCEYSEIVGSLPEKSLSCIMKSFDQPNASKKISSYIFERMLGKLLLWKLWKIIRNTSLVILLKKFELSNLPTYSYTENWLHLKCFLCLLLEFSKLPWERLWWNHFLIK